MILKLTQAAMLSNYMKVGVMMLWLGLVSKDLIREAPSAFEAISSSITNVGNVLPNAILIEISPNYWYKSLKRNGCKKIVNSIAKKALSLISQDFMTTSQELL
jgi:hypothetical protein